jgi:hypothetical protein
MVDQDSSLLDLEELLTELETLIKSAEMGAVLAARGVNVSLALVATEGLRCYLRGDKQRAAEEFDMMAEEIAARLAASKELAKAKPS